MFKEGMFVLRNKILMNQTRLSARARSVEDTKCFCRIQAIQFSFKKQKRGCKIATPLKTSKTTSKLEERRRATS